MKARAKSSSRQPRSPMWRLVGWNSECTQPNGSSVAPAERASAAWAIRPSASSTSSASCHRSALRSRSRCSSARAGSARKRSWPRTGKGGAVRVPCRITAAATPSRSSASRTESPRSSMSMPSQPSRPAEAWTWGTGYAEGVGQAESLVLAVEGLLGVLEDGRGAVGEGDPLDAGHGPHAHLLPYGGGLAGRGEQVVEEFGAGVRGHGRAPGNGGVRGGRETSARPGA